MSLYLPSGYSVQGRAITASSPADGATLIFGSTASGTVGSGGSFNPIWIPKAGVITSAYLNWLTLGTAGSGETFTCSIRLNNTTDTAISSTCAVGATIQTFSNTALTIAVVAGDYIEFKIVCPTWATNPTSVSLSGQAFITCS